MTITTTAVGFLLLAIGFVFCGIRFFRAFQKIGGLRSGSRIGILLSTFLFSFALVNGIMGAGSLFYARSYETFYFFILASHLFLLITAVLGVYIVSYIFFPAVSSWSAIVSVFILGCAVIALTIVAYPHPFIDAGGAIDFNFSHWLSVMLAYLLFVAIGSVFAIFAHLFFQAKSYEVRIVSFVIGRYPINWNKGRNKFMLGSYEENTPHRS